MAEIYRDIVSGQFHRVGDRDSDVMIVTGAGAPTDGPSGTGAGTLGTGSLYINSTTGFLYENRGDKASPDWDAVGAIDTAEIVDGAVTASKMSLGAVWENLMAYSIGRGGLIDGKTNGTTTVLTSGAPHDVYFIVTITEVFAAEGGTMATVEFGDEDAAARFGTLTTPCSVGDTFVFTGTSDTTHDVTIKVDGWGTDATGEFEFMMFAKPVA